MKRSPVLSRQLKELTGAGFVLQRALGIGVAGLVFLMVLCSSTAGHTATKTLTEHVTYLTENSKVYLEFNFDTSTKFDFYSDTRGINLLFKQAGLDSTPTVKEFETGPVKAIRINNRDSNLVARINLARQIYYLLSRDEKSGHLLFAASPRPNFHFFEKIEKILARGQFTGATNSSRQEPTLLNFNFKNAELKDVLRAIASQADVNIVTTQKVNGKVTLRLKKVPVKTALKAILKPRGYTFSKEDNIYKVQFAGKEKKTEHQDKIKLKNGKLLVNVRGLPLKKLLIEISKKTSLNVLFPSGISGKVDLYLEGLPPARSVEAIVESQNLLFSREEGVYRILSGKQKETQPHFELKVETGTVSLDVADGNLRKILEEFFKKAELNMILFGDINGSVNAQLEEINIEQFIPVLLEGTQYSFTRADDIYVIGKASNQSQASKALFKTKLFKLRHLKAAEAKKILPANIPKNSIKVVDSLNALSISSSKAMIRKLDNFLQKVDQPAPVVMIEALVVDYSTDFSENFSLSGTLKGGGSEITTQPGKLSGTLRLGKLGELDNEFTATLQALISEGKADIKARPKISAITGKEASVKVATEEFFRVTTGNVETPLTQLEKIESGVKLDITPYISDKSDQVRMKIKTEVSAPGQINVEGLPAINTREAQTNITVPNGETIIIGGLIQQRETTSTEETMWLSSIPVLGWLFTDEKEQKSKSELIFYITPTIIKNYENFTRQKSKERPEQREKIFEENKSDTKTAK